MFDWLFEGRLSIFLLLGLIAGVLGYVGIRPRNDRLLYAAGVVGFLILLYFILDRLVETDREQIERKMGEITKGLNKPDTAAVIKHMSEQFRFQQYDRNGIRGFADQMLVKYRIRNVRIWDVEVKDLDREKRTARVTFLVKTDSSLSSGVEYLLCRSQWVLDADDQWRMKTFDLYNPYVDSDTPLQYPF